MILWKPVIWILILAVPTSLIAADSAAAMLYAKGTAYVNGSSIPKSSAVFVGDLVQTRPDSVASIKSLGSSVLVLGDSLVEVQSNAMKLEHGTVTVATSQSMATQVGGLTITPAGTAWTVFQVTDTDGTVRILASKGDLALSDGTRLQQGEETTRDETDAKHKKRRGGGGIGAASEPILNSHLAVIGGVLAIGGLTTWVLVQGDDPLSPKNP
jgi:hypothetical protein